MRILLHVCCSVCATGPWLELQGEGHQVTAFFYNPNIHPLIEFRRRMKSLKVLQEHLPLSVVYEEQYGLREFLGSIDWASPDRCAGCYSLRMSRTAREAVRRGMDAFSTTLLTSRDQKHELVAEAGRRFGQEFGVEFIYRDWRNLAEENRRRAEKFRLYLQQYCGCIFSEYERFKDTVRHLYRGAGPLAAER